MQSTRILISASGATPDNFWLKHSLLSLFLSLCLPFPTDFKFGTLVHSFPLALPTRGKYDITEKGRGLGHVTPRKFGMPLSISPKVLKLQTSNLVRIFAFALPTIRKYDISEKGRGLGHVTLENLAYTPVYLQNC